MTTMVDMAMDVSKRRRKPKGTPQGGRFDREMDMADDLDLVQENETGGANPLRTVKGLARLLYRMGRTFDNLNTSQLNTEEFLRTGNTAVLTSKPDRDLLVDLRNASAFVLDTTPDTVLDSEWVRAINARLTLTAAMKPGVLRVDGEPVWVDTMSGRYSPGTPDPTELEDIMEQAESSESNVFAASRLFARLARMQPFGDGNKRTAMLAANGLLIKRDSPYMLAVPVEGHDRDVFVRGLGRWYVLGDDEVVGWLAEWNLTNQTEPEPPTGEKPPAPIDLVPGAFPLSGTHGRIVHGRSADIRSLCNVYRPRFRPSDVRYVRSHRLVAGMRRAGDAVLRRIHHACRHRHRGLRHDAFDRDGDHLLYAAIIVAIVAILLAIAWNVACMLA